MEIFNVMLHVSLRGCILSTLSGCLPRSEGGRRCRFAQICYWEMSWHTHTLCFFFLLGKTYFLHHKILGLSQNLDMVVTLFCTQTSHVLTTRRQVAQKKCIFPVPFEKNDQAAGRQVRNTMLRHINTRGQHSSVLGISKDGGFQKLRDSGVTSMHGRCLNSGYRTC